MGQYYELLKSTVRDPKEKLQSFVDNAHNYLTEFIEEFIEAVFVVIIMYLVVGKTLKEIPKLWKDILKYSLLLGTVNTVVDIFDHETHQRIKEGMKSSIGTAMFRTIALR
jgi:predicted PurR-regulated permease PerM